MASRWRGERGTVPATHVRKSTHGGHVNTAHGRTLTIMPTSPGALVDTLTTTWTRIRDAVPELPDAHITVVPTLPVVGHVQRRWSLAPDDSVALLKVSTHTVADGPDAILTNLLHEAAHVLCWRRGLKDTTSRGYYHTEPFLQVAMEVGLEWPANQPRSDVRGFADVVLSEAARERHAEDIKALADVVAGLPEQPDASAGRRVGRADKISASCGCAPPRRIWLAQSKLDIGPITCGVCGHAFT